MPTAPEKVRYKEKTGSDRTGVKTALMTRCMVRPRVARGFVNLADAVLHQCIRPLIGACCAPGIMDISAHSIWLADRPRTGHSGHQCSHAPGRPILHRRLILSQTSAGSGHRFRTTAPQRSSPTVRAATPRAPHIIRFGSRLLGAWTLHGCPKYLSTSKWSNCLWGCNGSGIAPPRIVPPTIIVC